MQINSQHLIQFYNESQTEYVYSALGEKLKTIHRTATLYSSSFDGNDTVVDGNPTSNSFPMPRLLSSGEAAQITDTASCQDMTATTILSIDTTEYIGNFIFENGRPDKFLFPGGYYSYAVGRPTRTGGDGGGCYYLTDHLGNNRVVVNDNGDIEQITHYYPFGAVYADAGKNPDFQKFKYTGKELDLTHGLNTYDHGARQNYSILGVWDRMDPMAEKYYNFSPYSVSGCRPIRYKDYKGKDWAEDSLGVVTWSKDYTEDHVPDGYKYLGKTYKGFSINKYEENIDNPKSAGLIIDINHDNQYGKEYNWLQECYVSCPDEFYFKVPFIDSKGNYPFYYTNEELEKYSNSEFTEFVDGPIRNLSTNFIWRAKLSVVEKSNGSYSLRDTLTYGFYIRNGNVQLLPITICQPSGMQIFNINILNK